VRRAAARRLCAAAALLAASACSPALDWREVRLDGGSLTALFPCKPIGVSRDARLADRPLRMSLQSCSAAGTTFAVTHADVGDPARVAPALAGMQAALAANLGSAPAAGEPFRVPGLAPGGQAVRLHLRGRLPDGADVDEQAVFFARGTRIYQAVVLGRHARGEAADTFFGSLRLPT
jgi:hypothetical protein